VWLDAAGITTGPVFRSLRKGGKVGARLTDRSVAKIVKGHAARVGLDPALFAGHSLRAGFLTSAAAGGASIFKMMDVSRHRSVDTLRGYVRDAEIFKDHAGAGLL
jgi:site-specific recombinase XerD